MKTSAFVFSPNYIFASCDKLECPKASIPQMIFQAIVASLKTQSAGFFALELRGIYLKNRIDYFSQNFFEKIKILFQKLLTEFFNVL